METKPNNSVGSVMVVGGGVAGCDGCVTVCEAGGMKEVQILASALRMYFKQQGKEVTADELSLTRQCDRPYVALLDDKIGQYDAVVSLACNSWQKPIRTR